MLIIWTKIEGKTGSEHQTCEPIRMVPHPRTLRKAREQVKSMVIDGFSSRRIKNYLDPPARPPCSLFSSTHYTPTRLLCWMWLHKLCKFEVFVRQIKSLKSHILALSYLTANMISTIHINGLTRDGVHQRLNELNCERLKFWDCQKYADL